MKRIGYTLRSKWPKGEPNTAYAQYFIGNSYLADVGGGILNVTFEPRCSNNWHIHHKQVQVLICAAGRGWYQEWGKEAVEMAPGTVIAIPAEAKGTICYPAGYLDLKPEDITEILKAAI